MDLRTAARALGGEVSGRSILCPGPGHSARDRSLSVMLSPGAPGGLLVWSHAGDDPLAAKDYVRERLALPHDFEPMAAEPVASTADRTTLALRIWEEARHPAESSVERYLARRGLTLPDDPREVIRFHPSCPFAGSRTPAMVALVRDVATDAPIAIHRTALDAAGRKVTIDGKDRLALGPITRGAVKLTPDAEVTTCLGVGEGIESTLSLRGLPEFGGSPVWSLVAAGGLRAFPVLPGIEALWIASDHDPTGREASRACAARWQAAGAETFLITPDAPGADLNDLVQGAHHD